MVAQPIPSSFSPTGITAPSTHPRELVYVSGSPGGLSNRIVNFRPPGSRQATPREFTLGALRHPTLRVRVPFKLDVRKSSEGVTVWSNDLEEVGYGPYLTAAVEDFQQAVTELYLTLRDEQDRLGPDLARVWETLNRHVEERP